MHTTAMNGSGKGTMFFVGLLCGAAAGAVAGLLLAPKPGADLRNDIADQTGRIRDTVMNASTAATQTVNEMVERGRKAFQAGRDAALQTADRSSRAAAVSEA